MQPVQHYMLQLPPYRKGQYMEHHIPHKPTSDLFPHVYNLSHFGPFQSIIKAPMGANVAHESFMAAFQQLPSSADK